MKKKNVLFFYNEFVGLDSVLVHYFELYTLRRNISLEFRMCNGAYHVFNSLNYITNIFTDKHLSVHEFRYSNEWATVFFSFFHYRESELLLVFCSRVERIMPHEHVHRVWNSSKTLWHSSLSRTEERPNQRWSHRVPHYMDTKWAVKFLGRIVIADET